jgi:hypothetical protein
MLFLPSPIPGDWTAFFQIADKDDKFVILYLQRSRSSSTFVAGELKDTEELLKLPGIIDIAPDK